MSVSSYTRYLHWGVHQVRGGGTGGREWGRRRAGADLYTLPQSEHFHQGVGGPVVEAGKRLNANLAHTPTLSTLIDPPGVGESLVEAGKRLNADLLVVGTRGMGYIQRYG